MKNTRDFLIMVGIIVSFVIYSAYQSSVVAGLQAQIAERDLVKGSYYRFTDPRGKSLHFARSVTRDVGTEIFEITDDDNKVFGYLEAKR